jgi:hypothetical protein
VLERLQFHRTHLLHRAVDPLSRGDQLRVTSWLSPPEARTNLPARGGSFEFLLLSCQMALENILIPKAG